MEIDVSLEELEQEALLRNKSKLRDKTYIRMEKYLYFLRKLAEEERFTWKDANALLGELKVRKTTAIHLQKLGFIEIVSTRPYICKCLLGLPQPIHARELMDTIYVKYTKTDIDKSIKNSTTKVEKLSWFKRIINWFKN